MAEQHSTDDQTSSESLPRIRWRVRSESTRTTAGPSGEVTLTRPLWTILAALILWFCQHHGAVQDQSLASGTHLLVQSRLQHHELTTGATGDAVVYHPRAMVSLPFRHPQPRCHQPLSQRFRIRLRWFRWCRVRVRWFRWFRWCRVRLRWFRIRFRPSRIPFRRRRLRHGYFRVPFRWFPRRLECFHLRLWCWNRYPIWSATTWLPPNRC